MVKMAERWMVTPPTWKAGPVTTAICGNGSAAWRPGVKNGLP